MAPITTTPPGGPRPTPTTSGADANQPAVSADAAVSPAPTTGAPASDAGDAAAHFDRNAAPSAPDVAPASPIRGGLPEVLLERAEAKVIHGTDPGDFYCEHMFFCAQKEAEASGSVVANGGGEKLVGFLHWPWDSQTSGYDTQYDVAERHDGARTVIGAALRGYAIDAAAQTGGPVRLLLTGYGPFGSARNNPTGEFVEHDENLDVALQRAFGAALLTPTGSASPQQGDAAPDVWERGYRVVIDGEERDLVVRRQKFPVTDVAIDPQGSDSIQGAMRDFEPHGVLSMGVAGGRAFMAEFHADDGGLAGGAAQPRHDDGAPASTNLPDNYALARAIRRGAEPVGVSPLSARTGDV
jgi:pyrrolidone-carboxylate peptidase